MAKFHITKKGQARECHDKTGRCPYKNQKHYPTKEEAKKAYDERMESLKIPEGFTKNRKKLSEVDKRAVEAYFDENFASNLKKIGRSDEEVALKRDHYVTTAASDSKILEEAREAYNNDPVMSIQFQDGRASASKSVDGVQSNHYVDKKGQFSDLTEDGLRLQVRIQPGEDPSVSVIRSARTQSLSSAEEDFKNVKKLYQSSESFLKDAERVSEAAVRELGDDAPGEFDLEYYTYRKTRPQTSAKLQRVYENGKIVEYDESIPGEGKFHVFKDTKSGAHVSIENVDGLYLVGGHRGRGLEPLGSYDSQKKAIAASEKFLKFSTKNFDPDDLYRIGKHERSSGQYRLADKRTPDRKDGWIDRRFQILTHKDNGKFSITVSAPEMKNDSYKDFVEYVESYDRTIKTANSIKKDLESRGEKVVDF